MDATLDATETARIRDDPGVDSSGRGANEARLLERRRAVAFARALIDGDGEGAGVETLGEMSGEGGGRRGRRRTFEEAPATARGLGAAREWGRANADEAVVRMTDGDAFEPR